jgi:lysozyme
VNNFTYDLKGLDLTEQSEGLNLSAYWDETGKVWTIGWGHTGPEVHAGLTITHAQAVALLQKDVAWASRTVNSYVTATITQNMFDSLVDFTFNEGRQNFIKSTFLKKINAGDFAGADLEFGKWIKSGGRVLEGLKTRRAAEAKLFTE